MDVDEIINLKPKTLYWNISLQGTLENFSTREVYKLKDNITDLEVTGFNPGSAGESKLTRSAAGAALGFLVAGPLGTLAGAGLGAGGARDAQSGSYNVSFLILNPVKVMRGRVSETELRLLQSFLSSLKATSPSTSTTVRRVHPPIERVGQVKTEKVKSSRSSVKAEQKEEKAGHAKELARQLAKLDFLLREQVITESEWEQRRSAAEREFS